ncbi:MAG: hypothetical protein FWD45_04115 [Coriobacteriia bacterium]|nr:hypothetical protein [Coriobacteriia bacterium]
MNRPKLWIVPTLDQLKTELSHYTGNQYDHTDMQPRQPLSEQTNTRLTRHNLSVVQSYYRVAQAVGGESMAAASVTERIGSITPDTANNNGGSTNVSKNTCSS